jgi:protein-S-isoprenylcysteine O-methyltransferase Ste14
MATAGLSDDARKWPSALLALCLVPAVAGLALGMVSQPWTDDGSWVQWGTDSSAWLLFVAGGVLRWWSAIYRGAQQPQELLAIGPYSFYRYPQHVGALAIACSLAFFMQSGTMAVGFSLAALLYFSASAATERRRLTRDFGPQYAEYRQRVSAFWLRPGLFHTPDAVLTDIRALTAELRCTAFWMWVPALGKMVAQFRAEQWWPHLLRLL